MALRFAGSKGWLVCSHGIKWLNLDVGIWCALTSGSWSLCSNLSRNPKTQVLQWPWGRIEFDQGQITQECAHQSCPGSTMNWTEQAEVGPRRTITTLVSTTVRCLFQETSGGASSSAGAPSVTVDQVTIYVLAWVMLFWNVFVAHQCQRKGSLGSWGLMDVDRCWMLKFVFLFQVFFRKGRCKLFIASSLFFWFFRS